MNISLAYPLLRFFGPMSSAMWRVLSAHWHGVSLQAGRLRREYVRIGHFRFQAANSLLFSPLLLANLILSYSCSRSPAPAPFTRQLLLLLRLLLLLIILLLLRYSYSFCFFSCSYCFSLASLSWECGSCSSESSTPSQECRQRLGKKAVQGARARPRYPSQ